MNDILPPDPLIETPLETPIEPPVEAPAPVAPKENRERMRDRRGGRRGPRREERARPEFDQKILTMRRVTRVVAGGRRFSFSVALVAGNRRGLVGVGLGKAGDTTLAIEKAFRDAKKNMITVSTTKTLSIPHDVETKYASARVLLMPAPGKGLVAGGAVRSVLEYAGLKDISAKILSRSKNDLNNARAAIKALSLIRARRR